MPYYATCIIIKFDKKILAGITLQGFKNDWKYLCCQTRVQSKDFQLLLRGIAFQPSLIVEKAFKFIHIDLTIQNTPPFLYSA